MQSSSLFKKYGFYLTGLFVVLIFFTPFIGSSITNDPFSSNYRISDSFESFTDSLSVKLQDTDILIIINGNFLSTSDSNDILNWWSTDRNKTIWILGDSDYNGWYNSYPVNNLLESINSDLRLQGDSLEDHTSNDGAIYRVLGSVMNHEGPIDLEGVNIVQTHSPAPVVSLSRFDNPNSNWIINTTDSGLIVDWDGLPLEPWGLERMVYDPYTVIGVEWDLPIAGTVNTGKIMVSGETLISDFIKNFRQFSRQGTKIDNILAVKNLLSWSSESTSGKNILVHSTGTVIEENGEIDLFQAKAIQWGYNLDFHTRFSPSLDSRYTTWENLNYSEIGVASDIAAAKIDQDEETDFAYVNDEGNIQVIVVKPGELHIMPVVTTVGDAEQISFGDMNRDGINDLVMVIGRPGVINYFTGNGDGTFNDLQLVLDWDLPLNEWITEFEVADVNQDNYADLLITSDVEGVWIYYGTEIVNVFTSYRVDNQFVGYNHGATFFDLNSDDSFPDLAVISRFSNTTNVWAILTTYFYYDGEYLLQSVSPEIPMKYNGPSLVIKAGDLNGDSTEDFVISYNTMSGYSSETFLLINDPYSAQKACYSIGEPAFEVLGMAILDINCDDQNEILHNSNYGNGNDLYVTSFNETLNMIIHSSGLPSKPTNVRATGYKDHIMIEWSAPASEGLSLINSYRIYRGTSPIVLAEIETVDSTVFSLKDYDVEAGIGYYYEVAAENSEGIGLKSTVIGPIELTDSDLSTGTGSSSTTLTVVFSSSGLEARFLAFAVITLVISRKLLAKHHRHRRGRE